MNVGDIVFWRDAKLGVHRFWEIEGVYLGGEGQEGIIGLRSLTQKNAVVGNAGSLPITYVPEPLVRDSVYSKST